MCWYRLLAAFLVLSSVPGHPQVGSSAPTAETQFRLEGVVINAVTGAPIPRALVQLTNAFSKAILTGPEGEFAFDGLPRGTQHIVLKKPGYFRPGESLKRPLPPVPVEVGPDTARLTLKLAPEGVIAGQVTGKDEEPLEGAGIEVLSYRMAEGRQQLFTVRGGLRTDEDGNFRVAGLASGKYYVAVKPGNLTRRTLGGTRPARSRETYPPIIYYPTAADAAAATPIELNAGQQVQLQFALKLVPAFSVAGVVAGPQQWRLMAPTVVDDAGQMLYYPEQFDPSTGKFEFGAMAAGTYIFRAACGDEEGHVSNSQRQFAVSGPVKDLKISITAGINIPFVVRTDFSRPRPPGQCRYWVNGEAHQSDCSDYPAARVDLISLDLTAARYYSNPLPGTEPLVVSGVTPGKYLVKATAMFGGYVQSLRCGSQDLLHDPLIVPEGGSPCEIEALVRDDYATLKVHVKTEKPGQETMVLVFPDPALLPEPQLTINNAPDGYSALLAPGSYKIYAFDPGDPVEYGNPEVMTKYTGRAATVTVSANSVSNVSVDLIHSEDTQ